MGKLPHETGAWEQYYTTKKDYFDQQIQAYRSEKSPDLVAKDATRSKSSDATTSNAKLNRNVEVVIHRTPNGKTQHNGAPNTGSTSGIEPPPSIRGRGFAFTDEEKRSMKEYWACNISKDRSSASALWERYAELHPHRSPGAWNALARRHPELFPMKSPGKNGGPDEDEFEDDRNDDYDDYNDGDESHSHTYNGTLARLRPYTKEEEDSLIDFIGKQGETIPGNAWVEFQREVHSYQVLDISFAKLTTKQSRTLSNDAAATGTDMCTPSHQQSLDQARKTLGRKCLPSMGGLRVVRPCWTALSRSLPHRTYLSPPRCPGLLVKISKRPWHGSPRANYLRIFTRMFQVGKISLHFIQITTLRVGYGFIITTLIYLKGWRRK
ncbi:uncharacterized protein EI90DRAFT_1644506 [Cantharellus anzutake]|uniref:uncharacterized protein n=1 Tax=Cantharellus anzutake TaxID=1750568 RepID=UPI001905A759|nr:uncharacterized protein EI90DRAFT_1644506 [Cantharellus anzutake]KAF8327909.1 hypothetical protein EI90DRAFT_1644506 [Cantharellus anzutake]